MKTLQDSLQDLLNKKDEEEKNMSMELPNIRGISEAQAQPIIPDNVPQEQVFTTPKLEDVLPQRQTTNEELKPEVPLLAQAETIPQLSKSEQLLQEYLKLSGKDQEDLRKARETDRMLKIGAAIGDALSTYINAASQKKVKAPGVQVQQGAGLGKIAEMFATSPEIVSDINQRRQALMEQYKQLATGEESKLDRALKERQIAAYEAQTRAQAKKSESDIAKEQKKEAAKLSVGEETLDREFAKVYKDWTTKGKADYEENKKIFDEAITALKKGKIETGTLAGIGARTPGMRTDTKELETRVRKGLNGMLRATLGAQFTQEEGERIFQQTFDPFASSGENIKNMETELNKIKKQKQLVEEQGAYFKQKGTLKGYEIPQTLEKSEEKQILTPKDQQALDWANKNPDDPRSIQIKKRLGM